MKLALLVLSSVLYFFVGVISLVMSIKNLTAKTFLPFHAQAIGKPWDQIDKQFQYLIQTLMKLTGMGFLVVALILLVLPISNIFIKSSIVTFLVPVTSGLFCFGLYLFNYRLYRSTNAETPWKNSLMAIFVIIIGFILSIV